MSQTSDIRVRVTPQQKERLINLAKATGYLNLSNFARSKLLTEDLATISKLNEISKKLDKLTEERRDSK